MEKRQAAGKAMAKAASQFDEAKRKSIRIDELIVVVVQTKKRSMGCAWACANGPAILSLSEVYRQVFWTCDADGMPFRLIRP